MFGGGARAQQPRAANSEHGAGTEASKAPETKTAQAPAAAGQSSSALPTQKERESYALGMTIANGLKRQMVDVDPESLARGLKDELAGDKTLLTVDEAKAALAELQAEVQRKEEAEKQELGEANMKEGAEFLAANKTKDGVVTLASGLQYKILTAGTGPKPTASDTVVCNYKGTLINGAEFDSSYKRGQPASFPVNGVIKGWTEALQLMPVGSKWELFIPPDLAYGSRGAGGVIGPNATLVFEVELLSIKGK
ncbi:MAG TPA: FKBP-type peptidyl-prolyl cis-trans isomerase [Candidatus Polarisedimenticolia bacterium]|nr:FKBP-type peptidyl-prolyl cis-trans isomerase [Candidatus Polarisedimenticolia bacterium]